MRLYETLEFVIIFVCYWQYVFSSCTIFHLCWQVFQKRVLGHVLEQADVVRSQHFLLANPLSFWIRNARPQLLVRSHSLHHKICEYHAIFQQRLSIRQRRWSDSLVVGELRWIRRMIDYTLIHSTIEFTDRISSLLRWLHLIIFRFERSIRLQNFFIFFSKPTTVNLRTEAILISIDFQWIQLKFLLFRMWSFWFINIQRIFKPILVLSTNWNWNVVNQVLYVFWSCADFNIF